jgi:hypothetical protein
MMSFFVDPRLVHPLAQRHAVFHQDNRNPVDPLLRPGRALFQQRQADVDADQRRDNIGRARVWVAFWKNFETLLILFLCAPFG